MQSEVFIGNNNRNNRVMTVEFGQVESYRIYIGFWRRFQQTVMKTASFITGNGKVSMFQHHLAVLAICRK